MKPVVFTVHKNTKLKHERRRIWNALQSTIKGTSKSIDGFGLIIYSKNEDGSLYSIPSYSVRDALDASRLPGLAYEELSRLFRNKVE